MSSLTTSFIRQLALAAANEARVEGIDMGVVDNVVETAASIAGELFAAFLRQTAHEDSAFLISEGHLEDKLKAAMAEAIQPRLAA